MRCGRCHFQGHNRRTCPLNNEHEIFVITYALVARRFDLPNGQQLEVQLPNLFHHAIVVRGREYGYGRQGITIIAPGTFYNTHGHLGFWRINAYTRLPDLFQLNITLRQMANIVAELTRDGFVVGQYCCFHRNCVSFSQQIIIQIFRRHQRVPPPIQEWPLQLQQYPFEAINPIVNALNLVANHEGPHNCIFLS